ncbi:hypothetical protein RISK_006079 [Rhodopirellula islandica]|uniref:Uncharacterized protein n=1 Tax=Rhodopirellula islandica TaxID=595434 RepID=A0A0J1B516_RHOIS|nr:hypothetical protein RISK_006079 [Rhodopirellula islandica]
MLIEGALFPLGHIQGGISGSSLMVTNKDFLFFSIFGF